MTTFFLFRHGNNDAVGRLLAGRQPGVHLNDEGRQQADRIAERFGDVRFHAIYSSPLERALETAAPLSRRLNIPVQVEDGFVEFGIGDWTGRPFADLSAEPHWHRFNRFRSSTAAPGGELMIEVQARVVSCLEKLRVKHDGEVVAVFSHADVIKAALLLYGGIPIDFTNRVEVYPGSLSVIAIDEHGAQVRRINDTGLTIDVIP